MDYTKIFAGFGQGLVFAAIILIYWVIAKAIADRRTVNFDDDVHITDKGNMAVGLRRAGLYLGIAIAMAGSISGGGTTFIKDVLVTFLEGAVILVFMFGSRHVNDTVMLANINNDDEAEAGNTAVGAVEAGMYIATGLILNGSFSGPGNGVLSGIISASVFFVIGQCALLLFGLLYDKGTRFDVRKEIEDGNAAVGIALGTTLASLGFVLRTSIAGPSMGYMNDIISFVLYTLYGMIVLYFFSALIDRLLLPKSDLTTEIARDRNVAALTLTGACYFAAAIITAHIM